MPRTKLIAGNWKMNTLAEEAREVARFTMEAAAASPGVNVAVCPPFPWLALVADVLKGSTVALGGQNLYPESKGAFTGEVSPEMLLDVGCRYVILGHSERRHVMGETDSFINSKIRKAIGAGLDVIFCVGELLQEREANQTESVLETQLTQGLADVTVDQMTKLVIAYEPVWAIGTGHNATPEQAQAAHVFIRSWIEKRFSSEVAENLVIQYGGSVKAKNAQEILSQPDVDGALVGGASLLKEEFPAIIQAGAVS